MLKHLEVLFQTKWPREIRPVLKSINKLAPAARRRLQAILKEYPDTVVTCETP
jgi:hypothetical protein